MTSMALAKGRISAQAGSVAKGCGKVGLAETNKAKVRLEAQSPDPKHLVHSSSLVTHPWRRLLFAPVAWMSRPPLPNSSAILRPAEVVFVLRFGQPSALAQRLGNLRPPAWHNGAGGLKETPPPRSRKPPVPQLEEPWEQHAGRRVLW